MSPIDPDEIDELTTAPKRTTGDEGTVEERSIDEVIAGDRYTAAKRAEKAPWGLRRGRIQKPGTP